MKIDGTEDLLDSRDILARIEYLAGDESELDEDERAELAELRRFVDAFEGSEDLSDGVTLVRDYYFTEYVQDMLEDCGDIPADFPSFIHIDWEWTAQEVRYDYSSAEIFGETFWHRA